MKFVAKGWLQRPGRLVLSTLLAFSALLLGALPAAAQTDVTGVWVLDLPTGDGNIIKTFLDLKAIRRTDYRRHVVRLLRTAHP